MSRLAQCALAFAALTSSVAFAQAGAAPETQQQQQQEEARRTPPPLPVVSERQIAIPAQPMDPQIAFGPSEDPPLAADPIPVRKNFAPELADASDQVGESF